MILVPSLGSPTHPNPPLRWNAHTYDVRPHPILWNEPSLMHTPGNGLVIAKFRMFILIKNSSDQLQLFDVRQSIIQQGATESKSWQPLPHRRSIGPHNYHRIKWTDKLMTITRIVGLLLAVRIELSSPHLGASINSMLIGFTGKLLRWFNGSPAWHPRPASQR